MPSERHFVVSSPPLALPATAARCVGAMSWHLRDGDEATATIEVTFTDAFPVGPPQVQILDAGVPAYPDVPPQFRWPKSSLLGFL
jgi:hypothetical protein